MYLFVKSSYKRPNTFIDRCITRIKTYVLHGNAIYYEKSTMYFFKGQESNFPLSWIERRRRLSSSDRPLPICSFSIARSLSHVHGRDYESSHGLFACFAHCRLFTLTPRRRRVNETRLFVDPLSGVAQHLRNSRVFNFGESSKLREKSF